MRKNIEGRALIIVIIVMAMLLILAPAIVMSSNTEVKQTTRYDNRMQAYVYARSGVDAALSWLIQDDVVNSDFKSADNYNGVAYMKGSIDEMNISASPISGETDIYVYMLYLPNGIVINSKGTYNGYDRQIMLTLSLMAIESPAFQMPDKALFVQNTDPNAGTVFTLIGNPGILGDFGANTTVPNALTFGTKEYITGDVYLYGEPSQVINTSSQDGITGIITEGSGNIMNFEPPEIYQDASFSTIPSFDPYPNVSDLISGGNLLNDTKDTVLTLGDEESGYSFGDFTVKKLLNVDLQYGNRDIVVENLNISGDINLINRGADGTLSIYVTNSITFQGNVTINSGAQGGNPSSLNIYYAGTETPSFDGGTTIYGNFVTETSDFDMRGNNEIIGHIFVGGTSAFITGTSELDTRLIYAPNAHVTITGTADCSGAIVADTAIVAGNGDIVYQPTDIGSLPPGLFPDPNDPGSTSDYITEIIDSYYWE